MISGFLCCPAERFLTCSLAYRGGVLGGLVWLTCLFPLPTDQALLALPLPQAETPTAGPQLTVLELGQEPRVVLRLSPALGQNQRHEMSTLMKMNATINNQEQPAFPIPTMKFALESAVTHLAENGDATLEVKYVAANLADDVELEEGMAEAMKEVLRSMIGITFKSVVDSRGFAKQASVEIPEGTNPVVRQQIEEVSKSLDQMISPLPAEAVGVGAKWQLVANLASGGMKMVQTTTFTITAIDGDAIAVSADVKQTAEPQEIQSPAAPGALLRLESFQAIGQGTTRLDLRSLMPAAASVDMQVQVQLSMESFGESLDIGQKMRSQMKLLVVPEGGR